MKLEKLYNNWLNQASRQALLANTREREYSVKTSGGQKWQRFSERISLEYVPIYYMTSVQSSRGSGLIYTDAFIPFTPKALRAIVSSAIGT